MGTLGKIYLGNNIVSTNPSGSIEITENGTVDVENYAEAVVNVSSGGGGKEMNFVIFNDGGSCFVGSGFDFSDTANPPKLIVGSGGSSYVEYQTTYNPSKPDPMNPESMQFSWPRPVYEYNYYLIIEDSGTIYTITSM